MPKKYFIVKQISKEEYYKQAEAAGKPKDPKWVNASISGSMNIAPKTWLGYTEEDVLEVPLDEERSKI